MTTRSEREKAEKVNEQHQVILSKLLKDDDNKYCADCQAKGPRWASWNLGVFMCIRCAGIHRNLGVHISRVKSVNLDQWTPEQIQSMVDMGNGRARQLYEAHLPENFRRPQTDQAVEVFIRDKYDRKRFYHDDGPKDGEKKKEEKNGDKAESLGCTKPSEGGASPRRSPSPEVDLLALDAPDAAQTGNDNFGPMVSNTLLSSGNPQLTQSSASSSSAEAELTSSSSSSSSSKVKERKLLSKDSILSLYATSSVGTASQQPQDAALAGPRQWTLNQVNQQMSGLALSGAAAPPSGQTLSNQLWK